MVKQQKTSTEPAPSSAPAWLLAFGERLERARGHAGLTQAGLAQGELSKSFVSLLETGRSYPSVETLLLLAGRLCTSVAGLVLDGPALRLDTALSLALLARSAVDADPKLARALLETVDRLVPDLPVPVRLDVAVITARAALAEERLDEAERALTQVVQQAETAQALAPQARALALLGRIALIRRRFDQAAGHLTRAVALFRKADALRSEGGIEALIWLGSAAVKVGRPRFARRTYEHALRLARRLKLVGLQGQALLGLGYLAWAAGDLAEATRLMQASRDAFQTSEDRLHLSSSLLTLTTLYLEQGRLDEALASGRQVVRLRQQLGNLRQLSSALETLAQVHLARGDLGSAEQTAREALAEARRAEDPQQEARARAALGRVEAAQGRRAPALRHLREALATFERLGLAEDAAEAARHLSQVLQAAGRHDEAARYLHRAFRPRSLP
ncbi:MAG: tetratricopeptide repeat protein [Armatimonadota bacterium]|nr:tetratricopeptide repeat protein [Armatimonadota bacterium]MDR7449289.1 tetratricopeptide repeat protein [Armatimonadota bacterium]MDR7459647.1 tetratricopeptide repeat protein [Armatimonadota bacterium]MDR7480587.1 tetratricopeptide repeat protein [Armatimonadota bacterium]MDR7489283.1 tetratricopeptide repeat protein [Armatimonadota bacterium]